MNEFRKNFLNEFISPLEELRQDVATQYNHDIRRRAQRIIHTVKGCSRSFGLKNCAETAADLESLLEDGEISEDRHTAILENLTLLIGSLKRPKVGKISLGEITREYLSKNSVHFLDLDASVFDQLTENERVEIVAALDEGRTLSTVRRELDLPDFVEEFRFLRSRIAETADVISVLPGSASAPTRTAFEFVISTPGPTSLPAGARVISIDSPDPESLRLAQELSRHVARIGRDSSKFVSFSFLANNVRIGSLSRSVFEILMHLSGNGVDHGITRSGRIEVLMTSGTEGLKFSVTNTGKGIDENSLASIFDPGYSTADAGGINSGRGIGLYIVKTEVERLNGKIHVENRKDIGTRFEIVLPLQI